jgi:hypothetical protein
MGRNWVPKLEWDGGVLHRFRVVGSNAYPRPDDGELVVFEREEANGSKETLCSFFADSFYEGIASAYQDGFDKGRRAGHAQAQQEFRKAIGLNK